MYVVVMIVIFYCFLFAMAPTELHEGTMRAHVFLLKVYSNI